MSDGDERENDLADDLFALAMGKVEIANTKFVGKLCLENICSRESCELLSSHEVDWLIASIREQAGISLKFSSKPSSSVRTAPLCLFFASLVREPEQVSMETPWKSIASDASHLYVTWKRPSQAVCQISTELPSPMRRQ